MAQQFTNNARSTITSTISASDTTLTVQSAAADLFPLADVGTGSIPSASSWFKATLQDVSGNVEIIYVRTRNSGSAVFSNIIRAREGTTARGFIAGTIVGLRLTAADVSAVIGLPDQNNTFTGTNTFTGPVGGVGLINAIYPVGSIYINATNSTNPGTLLGVGTWAAFGAGRVPVGFNASDALFDAAEKTGGSKDAIAVAHTHTFSATTSTVGDHQHVGPTSGGNSGPYEVPPHGVQDYDYDWVYGAPTSPAGSHNHTVSGTTASTGSSGTNANLQPYITVYMWKRTA